MTRTRCPFDGADLDQGVCPVCERVFNHPPAPVEAEQEEASP